VMDQFDIVDGYLIRTTLYVEDEDSEIYNVPGLESGQAYGDSWHYGCNLSQEMQESMYPSIIKYVERLEKTARDLRIFMKGKTNAGV